MPVPDIDTALDWRGRDVIDRNGEKIGKFDELYLDEETSRPEWAAVTTGLFGRKQTLIPLSEARLEGEQLQVPFDQDQVKDAPNVDPDDALSQEEERQLYSHYGMEHSTSGSETVLPEGERGREGDEEAPTGGPGKQATAAPTSEGAAQAEARQGDARSEERSEPGTGGETPAGDTDRESTQTRAATAAGEEGAASGAVGSDESEGAREEGGLYVGTEARPRERVRLKKYVVTEEVTKKVPVTREEVRVEREPAGEEESETGRGADDEEQVVLSEEEPVIRGPEDTSDEQRER
jgi:sporulation protein YlmC with PRC-barrel domain